MQFRVSFDEAILTAIINYDNTALLFSDRTDTFYKVYLLLPYPSCLTESHREENFSMIFLIRGR